jgi:hypothetical protein
MPKTAKPNTPSHADLLKRMDQEAAKCASEYDQSISDLEKQGGELEKKASEVGAAMERLRPHVSRFLEGKPGKTGQDEGLSPRVAKLCLRYLTMAKEMGAIQRAIRLVWGSTQDGRSMKQPLGRAVGDPQAHSTGEPGSDPLDVLQKEQADGENLSKALSFHRLEKAEEEQTTGFHGTDTGSAEKVQKQGFLFRTKTKKASFGNIGAHTNPWESHSQVPGGYVAKTLSQPLSIAHGAAQRRKGDHALIIAHADPAKSAADEDHSDKFLYKWGYHPDTIKRIKGYNPHYKEETRPHDFHADPKDVVHHYRDDKDFKGMPDHKIVQALKLSKERNQKEGETNGRSERDHDYVQGLRSRMAHTIGGEHSWNHLGTMVVPEGQPRHVRAVVSWKKIPKESHADYMKRAQPIHDAFKGGSGDVEHGLKQLEKHPDFTVHRNPTFEKSLDEHPVHFMGTAIVDGLEKATRDVSGEKRIPKGQPHAGEWEKDGTASVKPAERPTYPNGFLIPQVGDKVTRMVNTMFGVPGVIHGVVRKSRSGEARISVTHTSSMFGTNAKRTTDGIAPEWKVVGDPQFKRQEDAAKKAKALEEKRQIQQERREATAQKKSYDKAIASGERPATVKAPIGATVQQHGEYGDTYVVTAKENGKLYGVRLPDWKSGDFHESSVSLDHATVKNVPLINVAAGKKAHSQKYFRGLNNLQLRDALENEYSDHAVLNAEINKRKKAGKWDNSPVLKNVMTSGDHTLATIHFEKKDIRLFAKPSPGSGSVEIWIHVPKEKPFRFGYGSKEQTIHEVIEEVKPSLHPDATVTRT